MYEAIQRILQTDSGTFKLQTVSSGIETVKMV